MTTAVTAFKQVDSCIPLFFFLIVCFVSFFVTLNFEHQN